MSPLHERIAETSRGLRRATIVFLAATTLLIAGVAYSVWGVQSVTERITIIESAPCRIDPGGAACQRTIHEFVSALPRSESCLILRRGLDPVAYRRLTRC